LLFTFDNTNTGVWLHRVCRNCVVLDYYHGPTIYLN